jgi:hypothetical protein
MYHFAVLPLELVPLWAHLVAVLAGLIFGGLILIVALRFLELRSGVIQRDEKLLYYTQQQQDKM